MEQNYAPMYYVTARPTLIIISFSLPTLSFIPDLKPFSANPYDCSLFFFFRTDYMIPQTFTVRLFLLFFSFSVLQFLVVVSVR